MTRVDSSHRHSLKILRRPSTSPTPPPSSSKVYDSPPLPGDPDYQGEDLVIDIDSGRGNNRELETEETAAIIRNTDTTPPPPTQPVSSSPLPRVNSVGGLVGGNAPQGYSVSTSARTSYTRVDMTAMQVGVDVGEAESTQPTTITTTTTEQLQLQQEPQQPIPQTPQVPLCFLLISGKRRVMQFEPETTVGRVKELVWNAWPSDWQDERPPTPWHLRLLYLGKILQDDDTLKGLSFPIHTPPSTEPPPPPTIVHLSVRLFGPGAPTPDDEIKKKRKSIRVGRWGSTTVTEADHSTPPEGTEPGVGGGGGRNGCCGCVIS